MFTGLVCHLIFREGHTYTSHRRHHQHLQPGVSCTKKEVLESSNYLYLIALIMRLDLDGASAQLKVVDLTSCAVVN